MIQPELSPTTDFELIEKMAKDIWQQYYTPIIGSNQVVYMLDKYYSKDALKEQSRKGQEFWLVISEGSPVGYIGISKRSDNNSFIHKFYLQPQLHRKNIGSLVFKRLIEIYQTANVFRLQVNINNFKAVNFYFKCGFRIEKRLVLDIGEGYVMDDYIMLWERPAPKSENS